MRKFLESFYYFLRLIFHSIKVDIIFYYPQHFNRGEGAKNLLFQPFLNVCQNHKISYLVLEEPDYRCNNDRNNDAVPFDFVFYTILLLRKFKFSDIYIGRILKKTFLRRLTFNNYIVLSQSMLEFFTGVNSQASFFDLQHGILHAKKKDYIKDNKPSNRILDNNLQILVSGYGYYNILLEADKSGYFKNNMHVIGTLRVNDVRFHKSSNDNILVTLQFTEDHSISENKELFQELYHFIDDYPRFNFYLRNHPRFNNDVDIEPLLEKKNVNEAPDQLIDCFKLCSIHLTAYSSTVFECALVGIPTIFLSSLQNKFDMYNREFIYPLENNLTYIETNYSDCIKVLQEWASDFYIDFDERKFLSIIK